LHANVQAVCPKIGVSRQVEPRHRGFAACLSTRLAHVRHCDCRNPPTSAGGGFLPYLRGCQTHRPAIAARLELDYELVGAGPQDHIGTVLAVPPFIRDRLRLNSQQLSENLRYRGRLRDATDSDHP
jgi:hypothetical protein